MSGLQCGHGTMVSDHDGNLKTKERLDASDYHGCLDGQNASLPPERRQVAAVAITALSLFDVDFGGTVSLGVHERCP